MTSYYSGKEISYIIYIDKNSLYPEAMCDYLPYSNFKWVDPINFNKSNILNLSDCADIGYIFEVDLQYPVNLHNLHN